MASAAQLKKVRNIRLVAAKDRVGKNGKRPTFDQLAKRFKISIQRAKQIYYRDKKGA